MRIRSNDIEMATHRVKEDLPLRFEYRGYRGNIKALTGRDRKQYNKELELVQQTHEWSYCNVCETLICKLVYLFFVFGEHGR